MHMNDVFSPGHSLHGPLLTQPMELTWLFLLALNAGSLFQLQARIGVPCQQKLSLVLPPQDLTLHGPFGDQCLNIDASILQQHRSKATHVSLKPPPHMSQSSVDVKRFVGAWLLHQHQPYPVKRQPAPPSAAGEQNFAQCQWAEAWTKGAMSPLWKPTSFMSLSNFA